MWLSSPRCENVIKEVWNPGDGEGNVADILEKIKKCGETLLKWDREEFGNVQAKIKEVRKRMAYLDNCNPTSDVVSERKRMSDSLDELLLVEETMWRQRSRVMNLAEGDQNTKFFHQKATRRKRRNFIKGVRDSNGVWVDDQREVAKVVVEFFTQLFTSAGPHSFEEALMGINSRVTEEMNQELVRPFDPGEVYNVLFQMHQSKAPGPDGMNANFYQKHWHIVGKDVTDCVIGVLNGSRSFNDVNKTHLFLIPKVKNPSSFSEYRPIIFCNVIYKIASKVLVNRLKPFLSNIISPNQSAFTPGRLITDNTLVSFETFHYMSSANLADTKVCR